MIYIISKKGKLTFPVTPAITGPQGGDAKYDDVEVLNQGEIPFFKGTSLQTYSWSSHFPAKPTFYTEPSAINPTTGTLNPPLVLAKILEDIKNTGEVITLYIPDLQIEQKVQIRSFIPQQVKPGDIDYSITMVEYREVNLVVKPNQQTATQKAAQVKPGKSNAGRPPSQKKPASTATTYTVKPGDTLDKIAKLYHVSVDYLYQKNKKVIGSDKNKIKPGMVFVI